MLSLEYNKRPLQILAAAFPKAGASALNKMAAQSRSEASRRIRSTYNIRKGDLDSHLRVHRASATRLQSAVVASGRRLPLIDFTRKVVVDKDFLRVQRKRKGVTVTVKKGNRKLIAHAFIQKMKSGHVGVFLRRGEERKPIDELTTLSIPQMFGTRNIMGALKGFVKEKIRPILMHEIEFFRSKAA